MPHAVTRTRLRDLEKPSYAKACEKPSYAKAVAVAIGYPRVFSDIAARCVVQGNAAHHFRLKAFISTSEVLTETQAEVIQNAFGCEVVSRYATEEVGVVGQSKEGVDQFDLNTRSLIIEVLGVEDNIPVAPGEVGRIVVTDLTLRAMPLNRYDLGDLAKVDAASMLLRRFQMTTC